MAQRKAMRFSTEAELRRNVSLWLRPRLRKAVLWCLRQARDIPFPPSQSTTITIGGREIYVFVCADDDGSVWVSYRPYLD